ncbi:unnamed protein product [Lactuca saligna]|uniref:Uncharacterized protein n=1 Tax=Lactuca saligna TaxID=75948 RepID=A0AA36E892_LACSI|nr:unnamed protein product [Lactuca saligna]
MQFLKLNIWNGLGEAKSHFEVTKLFINSDIYEINEFKNKLKCHDNFGITEKSITTLQSYSSSYTDDFKGNFPLKTIYEITEPIKEMKFLLVASIVNIRQNLPWYIIPINVQDCTGTIGLTLFDREARRLLNISAYELKKIHDAAGDSVPYFPMQLNVLKNRKFGFVVDITEYNVNNYNNIYTVLRVTEDMSIVCELESKIELMSIQSVSLNQVALESDDVVQPVQKTKVLHPQQLISQRNKSLQNIRLKCHDNSGITEKSITTLQSYSSSYTDDFKGNFPLKTIYEITEPIKEMKFLLVASIVNIRQNLPWYIIPINVQDCTGTIGLTLFDREARRLLNISAYELKKIHDAILQNTMSTTIINIYTVLRVTEDMSIVCELESKIELMSIQSVSLNQVALESDDVVQPVQKDVISQTDESFTPSTVDKSTQQVLAKYQVI